MRAAYRLQIHSLDLLTDWDVDPSIIFMAVGSMMFVIAFFGCVGALRDNICLLKFFSISLVILFAVQVSAGVVGFVYKYKMGDTVVRRLQKSIAIADYRNDDTFQKVVDYTQSTFKCCGFNSYQDWQSNPYFNCSQLSVEACSVPASCCKVDPYDSMCALAVDTSKHTNSSLAEEVIHTIGCADVIGSWLRGHFGVLGAIGVGVGLVEIFCVALAVIVVCDVRRQRAKWDSPRGTQELLYDQDL